MKPVSVLTYDFLNWHAFYHLLSIYLFLGAIGVLQFKLDYIHQPPKWHLPWDIHVQMCAYVNSMMSSASGDREHTGHWISVSSSYTSSVFLLITYNSTVQGCAYPCVFIAVAVNRSCLTNQSEGATLCACDWR